MYSKAQYCFVAFQVSEILMMDQVLGDSTHHGAVVVVLVYVATWVAVEVV
jgi:hypothetical protein